MTKPAIAQRKLPRQRRSRQTVDAIVEATLQVLDRHAMAGFTTTRVAARAGVSVGTLYQYFPTREALLEAAMKRQIATTLEALRRGAQRDGAKVRLADRLRGALEALLELKRANPRLFRILASEVPRIEGMTTKRDVVRPATDLLLELLAEHREELTVQPSRTAVATVVRAVEGASLHAVLEEPSVLGTVEFRETLLAMVLAGLGVTRSG
jgi:AcrR family transcriptional regulator